MVDNEEEERKEEHVEPMKNPNPYSTIFLLEMEYEPKAHFLQHLVVPIENVGVKLNIFNAAQQSPSKNECFFLEILKELVKASFASILTKNHFSLPFIDQPIGCQF